MKINLEEIKLRKLGDNSGLEIPKGFTIYIWVFATNKLFGTCEFLERKTNEKNKAKS